MVIDFQYPLKFRECEKLNKIPLNSEDNYKKLNNWLKKGCGNLIFAGETGRKKTFSACLCAKILKKNKHLRDYEVGFLNMGELSQFWKSNLQEYWRITEIGCRIIEYNILIIDDLGVKAPTDSYLEFIYYILEKRSQNEKLATIYTTNLSSEELNKQFTPRIMSRITNDLCIKLEGPDERRNECFK